MNPLQNPLHWTREHTAAWAVVAAAADAVFRQTVELPTNPARRRLTECHGGVDQMRQRDVEITKRHRVVTRWQFHGNPNAPEGK